MGQKRKVVIKTHSKKEFYLLLSTNEDSDTGTIKEELQSLSARMSSFKQFIMAELLEVKMHMNENRQVETNIMASEIEISQGKNLIEVKHFKKINKKIKATNVSVNCFTGAKTNNMKHYMKPPSERNLNDEVVKIHTGTNDSSSNFTPTDSAITITNLAPRPTLINHVTSMFRQLLKEVIN